MQLDILSPDHVLFSGEAKSISLPGTEGSLGILDMHAAMITTLQKGTVKVVTAEGEEQNHEVNGGVVEVSNNKVILLAE